MRRVLAWVLVAMVAGPAHGYSLATSVSESCHEALTYEAIALFLEDFEAVDDWALAVPTDHVTQRLLALIRPNLPPDSTDQELFMALSIVVGVRAPDTEGHSTLDLAALRRVHADPKPDGQYAHALRGPADDGLAGDLAAIAGTKRIIREQLALAVAAVGGPPTFVTDTARRDLYVDHYDTVSLPVAVSGYHLGRAIHALQDAHAHMVRGGPRFEHVVHVTNFVDAVNGELSAARDGLAHSNALDDCGRTDVKPIAAQARTRSAALVSAFREALHSGGTEAIDRGLSHCPDDATRPESCGWIEYLPACEAAVVAGDPAAQAQHSCTDANGFCQERYRAVEIALQDPAGPYLGCSATPGRGGAAGVTPWLVLALMLVALRRWALLGLVVLGLSSARAEPPRLFAAVEAHGAALNDTPNASLLNVEFGWAVRFGYQLDGWRLLGVVDRSYWVPLEFGAQVDGGSLNLGVGAEGLFYDGFFRISAVVGPSVLMFDAAFDDAGTVGYFYEVRPAGLRWQVDDHVWITLDPLCLSSLHPVLRDPPLRKVHRRVAVGVEGTFL